jgi:hypothetical protein
MAKVNPKRKPVAPRDKFMGRPIYDSGEPLTAHISRADIRGAKIQSPDQCAAARCLMRQGKAEGVQEVHVFRSVTLVVKQDRVERYTTPEALRNETVMYDRSGMFEEGDYHLRPPVGKRKLGTDWRRSDRGGGADKRRAAPHMPSDVRPRAPAYTERGGR